MPVDWVAISAWGLLVVAFLGAAILIGLLTARLFLRATDNDSHRR